MAERNEQGLTRRGKDPELVVYRASAGSGKTFTLAVEYIKLLVENPQAYRNILAVTFTNKATAEMKERILSQLFGIGEGLRDSDSYLEEVRKKTGLAEEEIRKRAREALDLIIHDYNRFRVETIDTFSVSVMRNLAKELGVGTNLNIELNSEDALSEAVDSMVEGLQDGVDVLDWLSEYIMDRIEEDRNWRVFDDIKAFGSQIFNETFVEHGTGLQEQLKDPQCVVHYKNTLYALRKKLREELKAKAERFTKSMADNQIGTEDLNKKSKCPALSYFNNLGKEEFEKIKWTASCSEWSQKPELWAQGSSPKRELVTQLAERVYAPMMKEAERERRLLITCRLTLKHVNDLRLLARIGEEMERENKRKNRFLLSNINELLHKFVKDSDTPFVFEKLGTTISNVMMDEFQDTSRLQWQNFRPLIVEGLAQGKDSLIVGDVKQSIYRWRNGDWNILNTELRGRFDRFHIDSQTLATNRRSAPMVTAFNNALFPQVEEVLDYKHEAERGVRSETLEHAYEDVRQESLEQGERGFVRVSFVPENKRGEEKTYEPRVLRGLVKQVEELKAAGIEEKDMAILVRKGKHIKMIADYFSRETEFKLVSDEAFQLEASAAIGIIVDTLRCMTLPCLTAEDADENEKEEAKVLLAPLAVAYEQEVRKRGTELNTILLASVDEIMDRYLPEAFAKHIEELKVMPLYELVERLYNIFSLTEIAEQDGYVCAFLDGVAEYCETHSPELSNFVNYWDETLHKKTLPIGEAEGIRILTIHKAKGLEFHTVMVPFCEWKLEVETHSHKIWCKPKEKPFSDLELLPIIYGDAMALTIYKDDYYEEKLQLWVDNLNLLYVALTRAKENLFVWSKWNESFNEKKGEARLEGINDVSKLLMECLARLCPEEVRMRTDEDDEVTMYEKGRLAVKQTRKEEKEERNKLLTKPRALPLRLSTTEKAFEFRQSNRSEEFIAGESERENQTYIDRGLLLHNLFSSLRTRDDIPAAVKRLCIEGLIESKAEEKEILRLATRAMDRLEHKEWFNGTWRLFNECSIIFMEDGKAQTRRPDRVMVKEGEAVVLDYKFGKKHAEYHRQVKEYMQLMTSMGYRNAKGYLWYVFDNDVEEVRNG